VKYRSKVVEQLTKVKNRLGAPTADDIATYLEAEHTFLQGQLKTVEADIAHLLKTNKDLGAKEKTLRKITGIGPVNARVLIGLIPELGQVTRREIASLAGLAPHPDQSGISNRKRPMRGGRDLVRSVIFMAALSAARHHPTLKVFYQNLINNHKPHKVALAAVARKLITIANAELRPQNPTMLN
jgi:transposase